ncbi:hypothetical protein C2869_07630 [Saccharobesus litoralis]|uniref:Uncharacterized protein n=1 Tax=Saccharobesus litoralis TaxID=2172099 RepID=A0A2S0VQE5_9ALTE|nr:hypothetical protein [Saccharobesus litoralis]AWB66310.1 hypothetical protein C2869_07630 [Saccharobesus litoralis]
MLSKVLEKSVWTALILSLSLSAWAYSPEFSDEKIVPVKGNAVAKFFSLQKQDRQLAFNEDMAAYQGKKKDIWPSDRKMGHEGTDSLYYTRANYILGPYSEHKWVGRFLGLGAPF